MSRRLTALAVSTVLSLAAMTAHAGHGDVRIGIQMRTTPDVVHTEWQPLIDAIEEHLHGSTLELLPLETDQIEGVVERGEVDFVITDPAVYVKLEVLHGATRIASLQNMVGDRVVSMEGSTIITRSDRGLRNTGIEDIGELQLMAMSAEAFSGWLVALDEIRHSGTDLTSSSESVRFANNQPARIIEALRSGSADVGILPTGLLEWLIDAGEVSSDEFMVVERRYVEGFPFALSTSLYPSWAFSRLRYTSDHLAREVAVELYRVAPDIIGSGGQRQQWTTPQDYHPVHNMLRDLGLPPYAGLNNLTLGRAFEKNRIWAIAFMVALVLILSTSMVMIATNRRLKQSRTQLNEEIHVRRQAELILEQNSADLENRIRSRTAELEYLAHYDNLTGLPNRNLMQIRIEELIVQSTKQAESVALLLIGIDRVAEINNSLGRYYGDLLLQQTADLIEKTAGKEAFVARNGDETFVVTIKAQDNTTVLDVAHTLHDALDRTFYLDGQPTHLKGAIGISLYPDHGNDVETLLRHADIAMHAVRRSQTEYALYDPSLNQHGLRDLKLLGDLRTALYSDDQLSLLFQPKVDLREGRLIGVEALMRWDHPQMGRISPEIFIPLAERTGLIRAVTLWVLNAAFDQSRRWKAMGLEIVTAINLSAWNLQDRNLLEQIRELIDAWEVDPTMLEMEITEGAMMENPDHVLGILHALKDLGIRLSIDDFGTGFSSLSYLKRFPVDEVKIDKSFVLDIADDEEDLAIVKATVDLTHSLGMSVIAEGVNSVEAVRLLQDLGCDMGQGYHIGHPMTVNELLKWQVESTWGQAMFDYAYGLRPRDIGTSAN